MPKDETLRDWQPISAAPLGTPLELAVIEGGEVFALVFPCRKDASGWANARTGAAVFVTPTHWRPWSK